METANSYRTRVRSRLESLVPRCDRFLDLCSLAEGVLPTQVAQELKALRVHSCSHKIDRLLEAIWPEENDSVALFPLENLLIDYDWRFEKTSAELLCERLRPFPNILCLGTPTIFALLSSERTSDLLIDRNPFYAGLISAGEDQIVCNSVNSEEVQLLDRIFDAVVLDPPWYVEDYKDWLTVALSLVKIDGYIFMPMIPKLLREDAESERRLIYRLLNHIGQTSILPFAMRYETPSFEIRCLHSANLPPLHGWRTVDVAAVRVENKDPSKYNWKATTYISSDHWSRYRFGHATVAVRSVADKVDYNSTAPVYFLDSVSRRDTRRQKITAISSKNMATEMGPVSVLNAGLQIMNKQQCYSNDPLVSALRQIEACHA